VVLAGLIRHKPYYIGIRLIDWIAHKTYDSVTDCHLLGWMHTMLDLSFSKPSEVVKRLCDRLRTERLALDMTQADLAGRAGIAANTVSNLEAGRNVGFENVVRIAIALGRTKELESLFLPKLESIEDIKRYETSAKRMRVKRSPGLA
jgi:DNA-binding XRE family transcriptional regulator